MRLIKIGTANINTTVGAFSSNTNKIIEYMKRMEDEGCTVGCFQEQVISGYPAEDLIQWQSFVAAQWEYLEKICAASRKNNAPGFTNNSGEENKKFYPVVFTLGLTVEHDGHLYNTQAVICNGKILGIVPKEKLPTYGIFYENRTFSRGIPGKTSYIKEAGIPFGDLIFEFPFGKLAVEVCEDIWSPDGPARRRAYSGAELIINASASPFRIGIPDTRREVISTRAYDNQAAVVYINQVGGNDSLVFDGGGFIIQNGTLIQEIARWQEGFTTVTLDLDRTGRQRYENTTWRTDAENFLKENKACTCIICKEGPPANQKGHTYKIPETKNFFIPQESVSRNRKHELYDDLIQALITGLDYFIKTKAFKKIGIALSGGKDSVLSLIICYLFAEKQFSGLKPDLKKQSLFDFIQCFSMPSQYNSQATRDISSVICAELGVSLKEISIQEAFESELEKTTAMLSPGEILTPLTRQNIQARIRGERMMNWSNACGGMWIQTSNMSEKAVGYTTVGGDMMGAYSLIANLPKTLIIDLLSYINSQYHWKGVEMVLNTKASAELAAGQEDEKDLMPFAVLDACMYLFVEEKQQPACVYSILKTMWSLQELEAMHPGYKPQMLKEWVMRFMTLFRASIFKWVQTPQAVHVGKLELDRERALQLPVVQSCEWLELEKLK